MNTTSPWSLDLMWWATAVELPALAGLFWLLWHTRNDLDNEIELSRRACEAGLGSTREALAAYKLEVAQSYASMAYIKDVETRLTAHLERIELKLDSVQTSSHGQQGRSPACPQGGSAL